LAAVPNLCRSGPLLGGVDQWRDAYSATPSPNSTQPQFHQLVHSRSALHVQ